MLPDPGGSTLKKRLSQNRSIWLQFLALSLSVHVISRSMTCLGLSFPHLQKEESTYERIKGADGREVFRTGPDHAKRNIDVAIFLLLYQKGISCDEVWVDYRGRKAPEMYRYAMTRTRKFKSWREARGHRKLKEKVMKE